MTREEANKLIAAIEAQVEEKKQWDHCEKLYTKATKHKWNGGDCPVDPLSLVAYMIRDGRTDTYVAKVLRWDHNGSSSDIIAYWELEQ